MELVPVHASVNGFDLALPGMEILSDQSGFLVAKLGELLTIADYRRASLEAGRVSDGPAYVGIQTIERRPTVFLNELSSGSQLQAMMGVVTGAWIEESPKLTNTKHVIYDNTRLVRLTNGSTFYFMTYLVDY